MNRTLRIAALVAVVAVIGLAIGASVSGGFGHRGPHASDVRAFTDNRLSRLHDELKLSADQEPAWATFRDKVAAQASKAAGGVRALRESPTSATTIARLERGKQALAEGQGALDEVIAATQTFYAALGRDQQTRFDDATRRLVPGGFAHHRRFATGA